MTKQSKKWTVKEWEDFKKEAIIGEELDAVGNKVTFYEKHLLDFILSQSDKRVEEAVIERIRAKKVDVRPEITEWFTHKNRKQAEAHNKLLEEIAQEIEFELELSQL